MEQKLKECKHCLLPKKIFSKGLCNTCHRIVFPEKYQITKSKRPKAISIKGKERKEKYNELRLDYLSHHPVCEVCKKKPSESIHHKRGRDGDNLFQSFLATCMPCHIYIEEHPEESYEQGYTESRLT